MSNPRYPGGSETLRRAGLRAVGLGFKGVRHALTKLVAEERVRPLYQAIQRGLQGRRFAEAASAVLGVPLDYWSETDEGKVRSLALAPAPSAPASCGPSEGA